VENFFRLLAEEVRGCRTGRASLEEIVGRTDLLRSSTAPRAGAWTCRACWPPAADGSHCAAQRLYESPDSLATQMDGCWPRPSSTSAAASSAS
jgi:glutamate synthase (NADPH/NADH) large chain